MLSNKEIAGMDFDLLREGEMLPDARSHAGCGQGQI